jgi:hypothetical protein
MYSHLADTVEISERLAAVGAGYQFLDSGFRELTRFKVSIQTLQVINLQEVTYLENNWDLSHETGNDSFPSTLSYRDPFTGACP